MWKTPHLYTLETHTTGRGALDIRSTQAQTEGKRWSKSPVRIFLYRLKSLSLSSGPLVCVAAFAYAALCDTFLPKATQLCWSREDCFILYNIESLVVKYLLLVVAYPQPKLVESGSKLITGMHSSDRFRINQRKGWPQRGTIYKYRFRCRQTILPREGKYPR